MTQADRTHWDHRYRSYGPASLDDVRLPPVLAKLDSVCPTSGSALELACGRGSGAVWLASRGLEVLAVDVSPVAVDLAQDLARRAGLSHRCRFEVADLDDGLPVGPAVDVVLCHYFRNPRLNGAIVNRLAPGGLLAIAVLSEVDVGPGSFRAARGELLEAFGQLDIINSGERSGHAWLVGRR